MKILAINEIAIRSRQRKSMNRKTLDDLKADILHRGLLHAPVVRFENGTAVLVAGERRLTAVRELSEEKRTIIFDRLEIPVGCIPTIELEDKGEISNREAELHENVMREDLSWQDKVSAVNELHQLRLAQNPAQTKTATGAELAQATGLSTDRARVIVDRATIVAQHLADPDVQRAGSAEEAFKVVSRKLEAQFTAKLAEQTNTTNADQTLIVGDMKEYLVHTGIRDNPQFSCAIFDPPYGMGADTFGNAAELSHGYKDTPEVARDLMTFFFQASSLFMKESAHVYVFCDVEQFMYLRETVMAWGWKPMRTPLIWVKGGNQGHIPDLKVQWRRTYELILFASRGDKPITHLSNDTFTFPADGDKLHAAQKPVPLYQHLLALSCLPGDYVLDPCCGSGTIFKAAHNLRLRATGIELNEQYAGFSRAAIAGLKPLTSPLAAL